MDTSRLQKFRRTGNTDHMLLSAVLGSLVGAYLGPWLNQFNYLFLMVLCLIGLSLDLFRKHISYATVAALALWVGANNPPDWSQSCQNHGTVLKGQGCGFIADDLLIQDQNGVWVAKGKVIENDSVQKKLAFQNQATASIDAPTDSDTPICHLALTFRNFLFKRTESYPTWEKYWLQSFVLGEPLRVDFATRKSLKFLGLLHIVVLSGSHISLLAFISLWALRLVPNLMYSMRLFSMSHWQYLWHVTGILGTLFVGFGSVALGFGQSVQRSLLLFLATQWLPLVLPDTPLRQKIALTWIFQSIILPIHLNSLSMELSWIGYLLLILHTHNSHEHRLLKIIAIQFLFFVVSLLVFGAASFWSILANLILLPLFGLFLVGDAILLAVPVHRILSEPFLAIQAKTLDGLRLASACLQESMPLLVKIPVQWPQGALQMIVLFCPIVLYFIHSWLQRSGTRKGTNFTPLEP
jgi:predicted membrane metal-binding protein